MNQGSLKIIQTRILRDDMRNLKELQDNLLNRIIDNDLVSSANKSAPPSAVKSAPLILKILCHYFLLIIRFHISCSVTGTINFK